MKLLMNILKNMGKNQKFEFYQIVFFYLLTLYCILIGNEKF